LPPPGPTIGGDGAPIPHLGARRHHRRRPVRRVPERPAPDEGLGIAEQFSPSPDALGILLIALQCLPLAVRRLLPVTVTIVILGSFIVDRGLDYPSTARLDVLRAISYE
jgi:hypothetical protein